MARIRDLLKHISRKDAVVCTVILLSLFVFIGCSAPAVENTEKDIIEGYRLIEVDGGNHPHLFPSRKYEYLMLP